MKSTDNITEFTLNWERMSKKLGASVGEIQKKVSIDLYTEITRRTPVDTGRARANWQMTVGAPSGDVDPMPQLKSRRRVAKDGTVTYVGAPIPTPPVPSIPDTGGTDDIYIVNNLPYIGALEDGHSQQAPNGMIKLSVEAVKGRAEAFGG